MLLLPHALCGADQTWPVMQLLNRTPPWCNYVHHFHRPAMPYVAASCDTAGALIVAEIVPCFAELAVAAAGENLHMHPFVSLYLTNQCKPSCTYVPTATCLLPIYACTYIHLLSLIHEPRRAAYDHCLVDPCCLDADVSSCLAAILLAIWCKAHAFGSSSNKR
jgi:hypothetical protein